MGFSINNTGVDLPNLGIEPVSLSLLHWQLGSLPQVPPGKPKVVSGKIKGDASWEKFLQEFFVCMLKNHEKRTGNHDHSGSFHLPLRPV